MMVLQFKLNVQHVHNCPIRTIKAKYILDIFLKIMHDVSKLGKEVKIMTCNDKEIREVMW
jgi:hypothetical protein